MSKLLDNSVYGIARSFNQSSGYRTKENGPDNYKEIAEDGYVHLEVEEWTITWIPMYKTLAIALETLLKNSVRGKSNYLLWQGPGQTTSKYYSATNIQRRMVGVNYLQISATLTRRNLP